jgi:hypothetical protein
MLIDPLKEASILTLCKAPGKQRPIASAVSCIQFRASDIASQSYRVTMKSSAVRCAAFHSRPRHLSTADGLRR